MGQSRKSVLTMKGYLSLLLCLALLSVVMAAKKPKPSKPGKPSKPSKPGKPEATKPPMPVTVLPTKPPGPEVVSANEKFDEMAFAALPGCLVCLKHMSLECLLPCYDTPENPPQCLLCLMEKAPSCIGTCGFTSLASSGAYPEPGQDPCILQGQGFKLDTKAVGGNVDQVFENVGSAAECGTKCADSLQWTYFNKFAADPAKRFSCWCLNNFPAVAAEVMPRFDMESGFQGWPPPTPITVPIMP